MLCSIIWYINHQNFSLLRKSGFPRACHIIYYVRTVPTVDSEVQNMTLYFGQQLMLLLYKYKSSL